MRTSGDRIGAGALAMFVGVTLGGGVVAATDFSVLFFVVAVPFWVVGNFMVLLGVLGVIGRGVALGIHQAESRGDEPRGGVPQTVGVRSRMVEEGGS